MKQNLAVIAASLSVIVALLIAIIAIEIWAFIELYRSNVPGWVCVVFTVQTVLYVVAAYSDKKDKR